MAGEWSFGDPTPTGWLLTSGYLVGASLCAAAACRSARLGQRIGHRIWFWLGMALLLLLLGLNKQLDLQSAMLALGRDLAQRQGWYGQRRLVQAVSMGLLALGLGGGFVWIYLKTRISFHAHPGAFLGIVMLLGFVLLRAFEFNHVLESLLQESVSNYLDRALEGTALVFITVSAWRACRRQA